MDELSTTEMRLSKKLAISTGLSRREATEEIRRGEVLVNGKTEKNPATILEEKDVVFYKNKALTEIFPTVYFVFNKPKSMNWEKPNEKKRPSVQDILRKKFPGPLASLYSLADHNCGLLLLTNDESLTEKFNQQIPIIKQVVELTLDKAMSVEMESELENALRKRTQIQFKKLTRRTEGDETILTLELLGAPLEFVEDEIKNLGFSCLKVDRISFGGITKKDIGRGWYRPLTEEEILRLKYFFNPPANKNHGT